MVAVYLGSRRKQHRLVESAAGVENRLGAAKVDPERFTNFLNANAAEGWRVIATTSESRRTLLFFKREAFIVIMERDKN